jgi:hypothetical protein
MEMMDEIGIPDNARPWLEGALAAGRKVMGFGHRVYKNGDSRVPTMRTALGMVAALRDGQRLLDIYETLAATMYEAKGLHPNLVVYLAHDDVQAGAGADLGDAGAHQAAADDTDPGDLAQLEIPFRHCGGTGRRPRRVPR